VAEKEIETAHGRDVLMGHEGVAAHAFFQFFRISFQKNGNFKVEIVVPQKIQ